MKKMLLLLAVAALSFANAQAQDAPQARSLEGRGGQGREQRTPEQRADMQTKRLTEQLSLSADQQAKVREIFLGQANEMEAMRAQMGQGTDRQAMGDRTRTARTRTDEQLKSALTADQYTKYAQMRDERGGGRPGGGRPDGMQAGPAAPGTAPAEADTKTEKKKMKADKAKTKVKTS